MVGERDSRDHHRLASSKLYVGNLPLDTNEALFSEHLAKYGDLNMSHVTSIVVKRGYGFIDCTDQVTADLIIEKFHSAPYYGALLSIEPAVPNKSGRKPQRFNSGTREERVPSTGRFQSYQDERPPGIGWRHSYDTFSSLNIPHSMRMEETTTFIYVPQRTVGCLIGVRGAVIREMNRASGAIIKIENIPEGTNPSDISPERRITIFGATDVHPRAQWLIFERLRQSGMIQSSGDIKLTIEMMIPTKYVGRLIGKSGVRIQELQQQTSSTIKFVPFTSAADISTSSADAGSSDDGFMLARIYGTCFNALTAEARLRNNLFAIMIRVQDDKSNKYTQTSI